MSLRSLRKEQKLTLQALSNLSGVHKQKLHKIEKGKINIKNVSLQTAVKLIAALGCTPDDLLSKEE
ncbi:hypothetical protein FACS189425_09350 [Clostridia bacterium]|nr:hypothetical protein FACS189425_09350 [Clostridia bacterium]